MVAQWLAHLRLVLDVQGTIPPQGEENFGVPIRFLNSLVPFAGMSLDKQVGNTSILVYYSSINLK